MNRKGYEWPKDRPQIQLYVSAPTLIIYRTPGDGCRFKLTCTNSTNTGLLICDFSPSPSSSLLR
jgi:hypothetical protein